MILRDLIAKCKGEMHDFGNGESAVVFRDIGSAQVFAIHTVYTEFHKNGSCTVWVNGERI